MIRRTLPLLLIGLSILHAEERVFINDGRSDYEIVCESGANAATTYAAGELRHWVKESTGITLPLVATPTQGRAHLFVGPNDSSSKAGIRAEGLKPEGFHLRTLGDDVHLVGVDVQRGSLEPRRVSATQTGSLSAVHEFLGRVLGIRFLWHDQLGTILPEQERIVIPDLEIESAPVWKYRWLAYSPEGKCGEDLFARRLGLGHSHTVTHVHAWHQIAPVEKYGTEHPEWFAQIDGVRKPAYYMEHHGGQVCTTNPEVIDLFAKAAVDFFDQHPGRDMFSLSPNDGSGFCTCSPCRAVDNGVRADGRPILTDRLITFYNAIAESVAKVHPDKLLGAYAYSYYREPPVKVTPHPNLYLVHATNTAYHQGAGWSEENAMEQQWRAVSKHLAKYDIYYSPDSSLNLIAPVTRHLVEKLQAESRNGIEGGYLYMGQSYEQLGAGHLLLARLMWDPETDAEALARDYYGSLYGAAAEKVQAYYDLLETRLVEAKHRPRLDTEVAAIRLALRKHPGLGSPAFILSAYEPILDEATALISDAKACELTDDEAARLQRLVDQHELLTTTVRGMFVAARLECDAKSHPEDAKSLLDLIAQREMVRGRLKSYAPSLCANLDLGDHRETESLSPGGALAQLAKTLLAPRDATTSTRMFPYGDFEKSSPADLAETLRWSATGEAAISLETGSPGAGRQSLRATVPEGGTGAITFAIGVKPRTSYRITLDHFNDPAPAPIPASDDADALTRGGPPIAPRTRVIFRGAKDKANHWSGLGAHEHVKQWHTFPHLIQTPEETKSISFTVFLQHPGTYLLDEVKIEELGGVE